MGSDLRNLLNLRYYTVDGVGPTQLIESSRLLSTSRQYLVLKAQIPLDKAVLRKRSAWSRNQPSEPSF